MGTQVTYLRTEEGIVQVTRNKETGEETQQPISDAEYAALTASAAAGEGQTVTIEQAADTAE